MDEINKRVDFGRLLEDRNPIKTGSVQGIHFQADKQLPAELVRKLVKARIAENAGKRKESR